MQKYLVINTKYKEVELGLFDYDMLINKDVIESKSISKSLINSIDQILSEKSLKIKDLEFIAASQGPAPFTTLRTVLATLNGFNFVTQVPLIGVNALYAFLISYMNLFNNLNKAHVIALLNAFGNDLYYAYKKADQEDYLIGCDNYLKLLHSLKIDVNLEFKDRVIFIGNGAGLYRQEILKIFKDKVIIESNDFADSASLEAIKDQAIYQYNNKNLTNNLLPIYLKNSINLN